MTERRRRERGQTNDYLMIFDRETGAHIGGLANLSQDGAMLVTLEPISVATVIRCRVDLSQPIMDRSEVVFDAECRWCRKNVKRGWWESGYALKNVSLDDEELISYLVLRFALGEWGPPSPIGVGTAPMENRRLLNRFVAREHLPVREQNSSRHVGGLADLSIGGTRLTTLEPVDKGSVLSCRVALPKRIFQRDYLIFEAECVWCKKNDAKGWYESGYRLINVSEHDTVIIMHLMIHYFEEQPSDERVTGAQLSL